MTFAQLNRGPKVKVKTRKPAPREIALHWRANPTAPFLDIALGSYVAWSIGLRHISQRVEVLVGEGDDAGKMQIRPSEKGSWLCQVRGGEYCVFLDSVASIECFAMFPCVEIAPWLEVRGDTVTFEIPACAKRIGG